MFRAQQDDESSQELTVIEEECVDDHSSEPDILERAETRLGSGPVSYTQLTLPTNREV